MQALIHQLCQTSYYNANLHKLTLKIIQLKTSAAASKYLFVLPFLKCGFLDGNHTVLSG